MEQDKNKAIFESMPVPEAVRTMALPTIISQLIVLVYNMADTFYLGRTNNPFMVAGVSLILPVFNICLSLAGGIIRLFIADPETVRLGTDFLRIRCLATPLMFMSFFTVYTFQGFGRGERSLFLGIMRWAVFNIPMLFILNHFIGMYGIVWSQVTADILTVALSAFVYFSFRRNLVDDGELR